MSRVSIERRMERVRDAILPPGSLEWRLDRLSDELKRAYQFWRVEVDAINSEYKKQGLNSYEALLRGEAVGPPIPIAVHRAIWPNGDGFGTITADMTVDQAAEIYNQALEQGGSKQ